MTDKKPRILVVDDDAEVRGSVSENLEADGYRVFPAAGAEEALDILRAQKTDIILLDLMLPGGNGLDLIAGIRACTDAPIIIISGKGALVDKVVGLEMGADDYLAKPFEMRELSARVKANIRRYRLLQKKKASPGESGRKVRFGGWILDGAKFQIFDEAGKSGDLTVMEFHMLEALVSAPNCVLSREQLLHRAGGDGLEVFDRSVDIHVTRIRKKIGDDPKSPRIIKTVRGIGYMLVCPAEIVANA